MTNFIKNVGFDISKNDTFNTTHNSDVSKNNTFNTVNNSDDVEILDLSDGDDYGDNFLSGKYIDDKGRSFPAEYYYDSDGVYNARYNDGVKNVNVRFNVDGSVMDSTVNYDNL